MEHEPDKAPTGWSRRAGMAARVAARVAARLAAVTLVAVALVGCAGGGGGAGDGGDADAIGPTTTAAPASTTSSVPTAASSSTSPPAPGPACPGSPLGTDVDRALSIQADVDGDDATDIVTSFLAGESWHLRVDLADGGVLDETLSTASQDSAQIDVARDLDGDGADELWAVVGNGASATIVGLFTVDACDLDAVRLGDSPAQFAIGGPVLLLQGVACGELGFTHLGATSDDGLTYTTLDLTYELVDGALARVGDESGTLTAEDPDLEQYSSFDC